MCLEFDHHHHPEWGILPEKMRGSFMDFFAASRALQPLCYSACVTALLVLVNCNIRCTISSFCCVLFSSADNRRIPYNHRQRSFPNGSLLIDVLDKRTDSGEYKCSARSGHKVAFKLVKVIIDSEYPFLSFLPCVPNVYHNAFAVDAF